MLAQRSASYSVALGARDCLILNGPYALYGTLLADGDCDSGAVGRQPGDPEPIFLDGFESFDTSAWSTTVP